MKLVKIEESEVIELISLYDNKLADAESYVDTLKLKIKKLKESVGNIAIDELTEVSKSPIVIKEKKKRGRKKKIVLEANESKKEVKEVAEVKVLKKRGRKKKEVTNTPLNQDSKKGLSKVERVDWDAFVIDFLTELNKISIIGEMVNYALKNFHLRRNQKNFVSKEINRSINQALKDQKIIKQRYFGVPGFYYGLPKWIDKNNQVDSKYVPQEFKNENQVKEVTEQKKKKESESQLNWVEFILKTLTVQDKPLILDDFVDSAKEIIHFKATERRNYSKYLEILLKDMLYKDNLIRKYNFKGSQLEAFCLPVWFENEELKEVYLKKIE